MKNGDELALDQATWRASMDIALAAAETSDAAEMGQQVMHALDGLVACDLGSIITASPGTAWRIAGQIADNRVLQQNYWRYVAEIESDEARRMARGFQRGSDVFSSQRRNRLSVYREFLEPQGLKSLVIQTWFIDDRLWGVGLTRSRATFSDRDLVRLNAIYPHLRAALRTRSWSGGEPGAPYPGAGEGGPWGLTTAQERVSSLAIRGLTNKEIARLLGTSPNTVRNTLVEVFGKVGVSRRSELAFIVQSAAAGQEARYAGDELRRQRRFATTIAAETVSPRHRALGPALEPGAEIAPR